MNLDEASAVEGRRGEIEVVESRTQEILCWLGCPMAKPFAPRINSNLGIGILMTQVKSARSGVGNGWRRGR